LNMNPLHQLMNPRSIATVGAGNNPMKMGTLQALSIIKDGYNGKFYPIHPREETVIGHKAYHSVFDLPEVPDLAILIVPTDQVVPLLDDFGKLGTKYAVIITGGFKERGHQGKKLEDELLKIADTYGIRFLGPNCIGIINSQISLNMTVFPHPAKPGSLGLASQSGTYVTQTLSYLRRKGIRFSKAISVGNEANIDIIDALEYLGEDPDTKAIGLYIEGISDGRRFIDVAQKITPHKPVLAQYVGGSTAGARAGMSHTGSMAGPDILYEGIFRQAGIIRVDSIEDLYDHGWALATQPGLRGKRIGVVTNSGGPGSAIANSCDAGGLDVPLFSEKLQAELKKHIPSHAASINPVDMTFDLDAQVLSVVVPETVMKSGEVDGVILHGIMSTGYLRDKYPHIRELLGGVSLEMVLNRFPPDFTRAVSLPEKYKMPLIVSSFLDREDNYTSAYQDNDIPVFDGPEKAARAMLAMLQYKNIKERPAIGQPVLPEKSPVAAAILNQAMEKGQKSLDEYTAKKFLAAYDIPITGEKLAYAVDEAVQYAVSLGFPVAVKACSAEILHKTEKGLVFLNQKNEEDVRCSFTSIQAATAEETPVLISRMVSGVREFIAGTAEYPGFGPCVLFGLGGIFAEAMQDVTFRAAPLSIAESKEMLTDLKSQALLQSFRGMPEPDHMAIAGILQKLSFIVCLHPEISEIDVNPIIISDSAPIVADALIVLTNQQ